MPLTNEKFLFFVGARGEPGNKAKAAVGDLRNLERGVQSLARAPKICGLPCPLPVKMFTYLLLTGS